MLSREDKLGDLVLVTFVLGPAATNVYLLGDPASGEAVVIDPAWQGDVIAQEVERRSWQVRQIWLTHAHFDHFGGTAALANAMQDSVTVALHPQDLPLWSLNGGAALFGFPAFDPGPEPSVLLENGLLLALGGVTFEARHTPGHTSGHVMFVMQQFDAAFCGDLIFQGGVGRTDLPGGDWETLLASIREEVLSLPDATRLFSGHGPVTTVGHERRTNPFLTGKFHL